MVYSYQSLMGLYYNHQIRMLMLLIFLHLLQMVTYVLHHSLSVCIFEFQLLLFHCHHLDYFYFLSDIPLLLMIIHVLLTLEVYLFHQRPLLLLIFFHQTLINQFLCLLLLLQPLHFLFLL